MNFEIEKSVPQSEGQEEPKVEPLRGEMETQALQRNRLIRRRTREVGFRLTGLSTTRPRRR